jgi:hypothetical protein
MKGGNSMSTAELKNDTWHDVLIRNGFNPSMAQSLIGFVSWNKGDEFAYLGREITEVLSDYEGRLFAKDAVSSSYGDKALLFFDQDVSEETACKMFEVIMDYEQNQVYSPEEFMHTLD